MTVTLDHPPASSAPEPEGEDEPRALDAGLTRSDRTFFWTARGIGFFVLLLTGAVGLLLGYQLVPTLHRYGLHFLTETNWQPNLNVLGVASAALGTVVIAVMALVIAFPLALLTALYISDYAPRRLRSWLVTMVDLMAAVPSVVYGIWAVKALEPHALFVARWISEYFGWIPIFKVPGAPPNAAAFAQNNYTFSPFIASLAVAMMVVPLTCSVMRNVFAQAPLGEREAALALGATRWGMIRAVVLPFGRGGIVGGTMLGLGRALGETIAVLLIMSTDFGFRVHVLQTGGVTISSLIANDIGDSTGAQRSALLAAGFVLFLMTLVVNTIAAVIVTRSRSGAGVDA